MTSEKPKDKTGEYMLVDDKTGDARILLGTQIDSVAYAFVDFRNMMVAAVYKDFWREWLAPAQEQYLGAFNAIREANAKKGSREFMGILFGSLEAFVLKAKELRLAEDAPDNIPPKVRDALSATLSAYDKTQQECVRGKAHKGADGSIIMEFQDIDKLTFQDIDKLTDGSR